MKGGPLYLLLCNSMYSVDFLPLSMHGGIEYGLIYDFQEFGRDFTYIIKVLFSL